MKIFDLTSYLQSVAPLSLQEDYDNAGLLIGDPNRECTGVLCTLDVTEDVIDRSHTQKMQSDCSASSVNFQRFEEIIW